MVSAARQKVNRQTMQLFDTEVDRPEHDQIMLTLFNNTEALERLIVQLLNLANLRPFNELSQFEVISYNGNHQSSRTVSFEEAKQ